VSHSNVSVLTALCCLISTGQEGEEGDTEDEEQEDIFELDGMSELDINAQYGLGMDGQQQQHLQHQLQQQLQQNGVRGGWEGSAAAADNDARVNSGAAASTSKKRLPLDESVDKLDSMMELVFEHLGRRCDAGEDGAERGREVRAMMSAKSLWTWHVCRLA
jgi:RNA polymerase I-specific transcription initiation factor RRN3